jgi:hypothetical protein
LRRRGSMRRRLRRMNMLENAAEELILLVDFEEEG